MARQWRASWNTFPGPRATAQIAVSLVEVDPNWVQSAAWKPEWAADCRLPSRTAPEAPNSCDPANIQNLSVRWRWPMIGLKAANFHNASIQSPSLIRR